MNVYRGSNRRQVGAGIFSTIARGARPIILSLLARFKPHALNVTKAIGKRAAKAALNVGTDMATNLITGRLNKRKAKDIISSELDDIRTDANNVVEGFKQRFNQYGSGKRRKLNMKRHTKKKVINKRKPKKTSKKTYKRKSISKKKPLKRRKTAKKTKRHSKRTFNKDIFG